MGIATSARLPSQASTAAKGSFSSKPIPRRPRRFGKTLNLDTVRCFFSNRFAGRGQELFGGLDVWSDASMRSLQGSLPIISLSFARVKQRDYESAMQIIRRILRTAVQEHDYLLDSPAISPEIAHSCRASRTPWTMRPQQIA